MSMLNLSAYGARGADDICIEIARDAAAAFEACFCQLMPLHSQEGIPCFFLKYKHCAINVVFTKFALHTMNTLWLLIQKNNNEFLFTFSTE